MKIVNYKTLKIGDKFKWSNWPTDNPDIWAEVTGWKDADSIQYNIFSYSTKSKNTWHSGFNPITANSSRYDEKVILLSPRYINQPPSLKDRYAKV